MKPVKVKVVNRPDVFNPLAMDGKSILDMFTDFEDQGISQIVTFTEDVGKKPISMSADLLGENGVQLSIELLANHLLPLFSTSGTKKYTRARANTWFPVNYRHWDDEEDYEHGRREFTDAEDPNEWMLMSPHTRHGLVCVTLDDTGWVESWIIDCSIGDDGKSSFSDEADLMWQGHIDEIGNEDSLAGGGMMLTYKAIYDHKDVMFSRLRDSIVADLTQNLMSSGDTTLLNRAYQILQHERWIEVLTALGGTIASDAFYYGVEEDPELEGLVREMVAAVEASLQSEES